jgi:two-component system, OmpR family, sensor histidine kinase KdpD
MVESERGKLKVYLGYAAGVGKTYMMLEEARNLKSQGLDIVIGYFEPHGRKDTIAKAEGLEAIPRKVIFHRGSHFEEMDTDAVLARRPQICVVDEFAHTNVPGSDREKRWADIEVLLNAGIHVLTTVNIQHLESLNDQVKQITGVQVRETIPDWMLRRADEVVLVDLTPRALLHRLDRGVIYSPEKAERARQNFFRESNLVALRSLALRETVHEVEHRVESGDGHAAVEEAVETPASQKILALVTADPATAMLIRRARRMSNFLEGECFAVAVQPLGDLKGLPDVDRDAVERHLNFARNMRIETRILEGEDVALTLVDFARRNQVTQIYLVRPPDSGLPSWLARNLVQKIAALGRDMQIVIVAP